jgi:hypothetical protein
MGVGVCVDGCGCVGGRGWKCGVRCARVRVARCRVLTPRGKSLCACVWHYTRGVVVCVLCAAPLVEVVSVTMCVCCCRARCWLQVDQVPQLPAAPALEAAIAK